MQTIKEQPIQLLHEKFADNVLERQKLHEITTLAEELKRLIARHGDILKEEGIRRQMETLESWLENERKGPVPAHVVSESGIKWLGEMRDRLKLSADECLRFESEGGNPCSIEQNDKVEELLKTIRRIDRIIQESSVTKPH